MPVIFPPISEATPEGLVAIGGDLELDTLLTAYSSGIFPWPISEEDPLTWFSPNPRGILRIDNAHFSKSFMRFLKKNSYQIKFNHDFENVIRNCAKVPRKEQSDTWISKEIVQGYHQLFQHGLAYSVEVYDDQRLIGGVYGVCLGQIISGESMFHFEDNASKLALYYLIERLKKCHIPFLDTQMVTPIVASLGGEETPRDDYLSMLKVLNPNIPTRQELFSLV